MKNFTWQQVVLIVALLAALILAGRLGGNTVAVTGGAITTIIAFLTRSPLTEKEEK